MVPSSNTETQHRYAICVGINSYHSLAQVIPLACAENDAQALHDLLQRKGFDKEYCRLLLGAEATSEAIKYALDTFLLTDAHKDDLVVLYFAGHGLPISVEEEVDETEQPSEVFLTTYDFDLQKVMHERAAWLNYPLRMGKLRTDYFEQTRSRKVLFIFDSCHSGDFFGNRYRDRDTGSLATNYIEQPFAKHSTGRIVLSSCLPHQQSREDVKRKHGVFTYHLLEALEGRVSGVIRSNGWITVGSLFDCLADALPDSQRPVKTGVEHDSFKLLYYPPHSLTVSLGVSPPNNAEHIRLEKQRRLEALLDEHSGFLRDRLGSFVGRGRELDEVRQRIAEKLLTGGYITITGQAGQGKSSLIAKLVEEYDQEQTAFHFIPLNPGPDHQIGLLRKLMARLILKYDLPDFYVGSESRPALRDYFPRVLEAVVAKGGQEVIFVDGLDQLEEEHTGQRDLTFLPQGPENPPPGIVFVLGTRPNDTLKPLELLKSRYEYQLPDLSRQDFNLILQHRGVNLDPGLADRFYHAMQCNALYLDLVAKELRESRHLSPTKLIQQLVDNPENLFSLATDRFKRQWLLWRDIIKPVLGVLLVVQEPISRPHLRQIIGVDTDSLNEGLERLGGLVINDGRYHSSLYHLKFQDYLREDPSKPKKKYIFAQDEVEGWHKRLAYWCEQQNLTRIWEDVQHDETEQGRREYARRHYITHLYYAQQWQSLFAVLDAGQYGQAKVNYDASTYLYAQDLNLGRQAAVWEEWTIAEGLDLLPHLWRYTLLRCSLTSRADSYSIERFEALVAQKREREALEIAELLTDTHRKVSVLLRIVQMLSQQSGMERERLQVLMRAHEMIGFIEGKREKASLCCEIGSMFAQIEQQERVEAIWTEAETLILSIVERGQKVWMLRKLVQALMQAQQWERAEAAARAIEESESRAVALRELGQALVQAQQWERAEVIWAEAEAATQAIEIGEKKTEELCKLSQALIQAQQRERAEAAARAIEESESRAVALRELGQALVQAQQWERAEAVWAEAEAAAQAIEESESRAVALRELGQALVQAQQWERAEVIWGQLERRAYIINDKRKRSTELIELSEVLIQAQLWDWAKAVLEKAEQIAQALEDSWEKAEIFRELSLALIQARQWERADAIWTEADTMASILKNDFEKRAWALRELRRALEELQQPHQRILDEIPQPHQIQLVMEEATDLESTFKENWKRRAQAIYKRGKALMQAQQWERAEAAARAIEESESRAVALRELGQALVQAQQWERAEVIWAEAEAATQAIEIGEKKTEELCKLSQALIRAQQWERAEAAAQAIEESRDKVAALGELGLALVQAQQWDRAEVIWAQAEAVAYTIKENVKKATTLRSLTKLLIRAQRWERANAVINAIDEIWKTRFIEEPGEGIERGDEEIEDLVELGERLWQTQQWEQAERIWIQAEAMALNNGVRRKGVSERMRYLRMRHSQSERERIASLAHAFEGDDGKISALRELASALAQAQQWRRAETAWAEAEAAIRSHKESWERARVLRELGKALVQAGHQEKAKPVWVEAKAVAHTIEDNLMRITALHDLLKTLIQGLQWDEAEDLVYTFKEGRERVVGLLEFGRALVQAEQWQRAETVIQTIEESKERAIALLELGQALAKAQEWKFAAMVWGKAEDAAFLIEISEERLEVLCEMIETLFQAQRGEQAGKLWAVAEKIARTLKDGKKKAITLRRLWRILAQSEQWGRTRTIVHSIKDKWERAVALGELGLALVLANEREQAEALFAESEAIARTIKLNWQRAEALHELSKLLVNAGLWGQAEAVARAIEENSERAAALRELSEAKLQIKEWEQATVVAQTIEMAEEEAVALHSLSLALMQAQQWPEAEWAARAIEDTKERTAALRKLGWALVEAQQWERAEFVVLAIDVCWEKVAALGELGRALIEVQQWERAEVLWMEAETTARALKEGSERATALRELGQALAEAKQHKWADRVWVEATDVACTIREDEKRAAVLRELGKVLAQAQRWKQAVVVARAIEKKEERASVLCHLSEALALAQRWKRAEAIAWAIRDGEKRAGALLKLSMVLAVAQQWEQSKRVAVSIEVEEPRTTALHELSKALIEARQWESAAEVAWAIKSDERRMEALQLLGDRLEAAGAYESLLHLIQHSWLKTATRAEALTLLLLANRLISMKPEIGTAFHEAFAWVDAFLRGGDAVAPGMLGA